MNVVEHVLLRCPRELISVGMDNEKYMQGPGFKLRPPKKKCVF